MDQTLQIFVNQLVLLTVQALFPVLVTLVVGLVYRLYQNARSRLSAEQLQALEILVSIFVKAAEQADLKQGLLKLGEEKKAWVIEQVQRELNARGWTGITADLIAGAIEAAVRDGVHRGWPAPALVNAVAEFDPRATAEFDELQ